VVSGSGGDSGGGGCEVCWRPLCFVIGWGILCQRFERPLMVIGSHSELRFGAERLGFVRME